MDAHPLAIPAPRDARALRPAWLRRRSPLAIVYIVLTVHGLLTLFPLAWVLSNSFRSTENILTSVRLLPEHLDFSNYTQFLETVDIGQAFFNSLTITLATLGLLLTVAVPLAFVIARFRFRAAKWIFLFFGAAILVPSVSILPMTYRLFNDLGLMGSRYGIALVYATEQLPVAVFLLVTFMRTIPQELDEAGLIDGCGVWDLFVRVILPLSRNGIITVLILAFVAVWNDYLTALVLLPDQENRTLSLALAFAKDEYFVNYGMMSAAIVFAVTPMLIAYIFLKDRLRAGMAAGAVKG